MSQICQTLKNWKFELVLTARDGMAVVEAKRTASTEVSQKTAARSLLELTRRQDEALAYLRPRGPQYLTQRMWEIDNTDWDNTSEADEAKLIYEYGALAAEIGIGPKLSSDGIAWPELLAL